MTNTNDHRVEVTLRFDTSLTYTQMSTVLHGLGFRGLNIVSYYDQLVEQ
jgi:hypothetical protein